MNKVSIRVPATSANCGSGFDTLGLACTLYNEVTYEITSSRGFQLEVTGEGAEYLKPCGRNLAFASFVSVFSFEMQVLIHEILIFAFNLVELGAVAGNIKQATTLGIEFGDVGEHLF